MRELSAREVKKLMTGCNSAKAVFEKVAEELKYGRDEWWWLWHLFKAGVDYERQREKPSAPIVLHDGDPNDLGVMSESYSKMLEGQ